MSGRTLLYLKSPSSTIQTFLTGLRYDLRANVDQPFQTHLGGEESLRGYNDIDLPTGSTLVGFIEERINIPWFRPAVDLGFSAYFDYGRGWSANVPFAQDTGWRGSIGGGLRIGFPAGTGTVTHLAIAWPIGQAAKGLGPAFRTYFVPVETNR